MNKKYLRWGVIIALVVAGSVYFFMHKSPSVQEPVVEVQPEKTPYIIQTATVDDLRTASKITKYGKLVGTQEISITSKVAGRISSLDALPGEKVNKNDVIITLEDTNASATFQVQRARLQLATARSAYNITITQVNQGITDANSFLQQAKTQYASIRQNGSSTASLQVNQLGSQVESAQLQYNTLVDSNKQTLQNFISTAKNIAKEVGLLYYDITQDTDQILGVSDLHEQSNDSFENSLGAQNTSTRRDAQNELRILFTKENMFTQTGQSYTEATLVSNLQTLKGNLQLLSPVLDKMEVMLQYTHSSTSLPQAQIDGWFALINGFQAQLQGKVTVITEQINAMQSFLATYKNNESSALKQVQLIQQQGNITESTLGDNEELARLQVERAQTAYDNALQNKNQSIVAAQNNLDQAQIALNESEDLLGKFEVQSPIKGTVGDVLVDVGQEVSPGMPLVSINSTDSQQVEISLTQEEIGFVDVGQEVNVNNNGKSFVGFVTSISSTADNNFTYKATIEFAEKIQLFGDLASVNIDVVTDYPLIPLNVVTILNSNEGLINTREDGAIKPLRVELGKVRGESVEVLTELDDKLLVIVSDVNNYNSTIHELQVKKAIDKEK